MRLRACGWEFCGSVRAVEKFAVACVRLKILRLRACGSVFFFAVADAVEPQNRWPSLSVTFRGSHRNLTTKRPVLPTQF